MPGWLSGLERWTGDAKVEGSNPFRSTRKTLSFPSQKGCADSLSVCPTPACYTYAKQNTRLRSRASKLNFIETTKIPAAAASVTDQQPSVYGPFFSESRLAFALSCCSVLSNKTGFKKKKNQNPQEVKYERFLISTRQSNVRIFGIRCL